MNEFRLNNPKTVNTKKLADIRILLFIFF